MLQRLHGLSDESEPADPAGCDAIRFYGLLYIDRKRNRDPNLLFNLSDPVEVYVGCASLLASSARACGVSFGLFTNDPGEVERIIGARGFPPFPVIGIAFSRDVPQVGKFYSAHYKLDAMKALATGRYGKTVGLIDVDTFFLRAMPPSVVEAAADGFVAYDVSSGPNPTHWDRHVPRDLELVGASHFEAPKWYGGELLISTSDRFGALLDEVEACWPRYIDNIGTLHHVGDEAPVSAALNRLAQRGERIVDAGRSGIVSRWWSVRTKFPQPAFEELESRVILHLPGDKKFLAAQAVAGFDRASFLDGFKRVLHRRRAIWRCIEYFDPYVPAEVVKA